MTENELLAAVKTGIEALAVAPLSTFECYIGPQSGTPPNEHVILYSEGCQEIPVGISAGTGSFYERIRIRMEARFNAAATSTDRDKGQSCIAQLKKFVRDNRRITAGGDKSRYATYESDPLALDGPAGGETSAAREQRVAAVTGTWEVPGE